MSNSAEWFLRKTKKFQKTVKNLGVTVYNGNLPQSVLPIGNKTSDLGSSF